MLSLSIISAGWVQEDTRHYSTAWSAGEVTVSDECSQLLCKNKFSYFIRNHMQFAGNLIVISFTDICLTRQLLPVFVPLLQVSIH